MSNTQKEYITNLKKLDFQTENNVDSSVFLVDKLEVYIGDNISPYIIVALEKAKVFNVDAVYFRFFENERPPLAQFYIFDNITNPHDEEYYIDRHRKIWSACEVVCFFIIEKTTIKIFDSWKPITINQNGSKIIPEPIDQFDLTNLDDVIRIYNTQYFDNGSFWENKRNSKNFLNNKAASERLIDGLKQIRILLHDRKTLSKELIDKLLIICILIKYLEENGWDIDKDTGKRINLAHEFFKTKTGYEELEAIIRNNKLNDLLLALAGHFHGDIFCLQPDQEEELKNASIDNITELARYFEAGYKTSLFGWHEYSFEYIPVELISNFYEEFIPKNIKKADDKSKTTTGAVYTPAFLVNLLVDECLPLSFNELNENVKLIDPACGSGIFLVTAYKRLIQRWRIRNRQENKLADTKPDILKKILKKNIFGIDINENSVNLSVFSLQLALCSMLTPRQIWTELQFSNLQSDGNIIKNDFFEYLVNNRTSFDFDLVIGNPPFKRRKLDGKSYKHYQDILEARYPIKFNNPQREFAFLFLEKSMHLLEKKKGRLCLILPAGPFLYTNDSVDIRKSLFSIYNVSQIIDFTFLRRILFQATVASLAIFVEYLFPKKDDILHITAKRTKSSKEKIYFEFDHYDYYQIPRELAKGKAHIWKSSLLGGNRVYDIVEKLDKLKPALFDFYLSNDITTKANGIQLNDIYSGYKKETDNYSLFHDEITIPQKNEKFWGIKMKISKGSFPSEITISDFEDGAVRYAIGFKGPADKINLLKDYFLKYSNVLCFYVAAVSGRQGIRSPYVFYLSDADNFPFIDDLDARISVFEKMLIDDIVDYTLEEFGNGEKALINTEMASKKDLIEFSKVYCDLLNEIYSYRNKKYKLLGIIEGDAYYICEICHTNKEIITQNFEKTNQVLNNLLFQWNPSHSGKINKILRVYSNNAIRIIKPKLLRFWLKSKALRDADETFDDILKGLI